MQFFIAVSIVNWPGTNSNSTASLGTINIPIINYISRDMPVITEDIAYEKRLP